MIEKVLLFIVASAMKVTLLLLQLLLVAIPPNFSAFTFKRCTFKRCVVGGSDSVMSPQFRLVSAKIHMVW